MSKQKKEQQKKRKKEQVRKERLAKRRETFTTGSVGGNSTVRIGGIEISCAPQGLKPPVSPEREKLVVEALALADKKKYEEAIRLLVKVNESGPEHPAILYNIAVFRKVLGDTNFHDETIDKLIKDFPDYFFGKIAYAERLIGQHRLDEAWGILDPICRSKHLHAAEYKALLMATVAFQLASGDDGAAELAHKVGKDFFRDEFPTMENFYSERIRNSFARLAKMGTE